MSLLASLSGELEGMRDLDTAESEAAALALAGDEASFEEKKRFLERLREKGETVEEVAAFAQVFRGLARDPELGEVASRAIDIVGTGGSGSSGYNVSSASAVVVAAMGVPVLKHGNRAVTSQSGSADFLGLLGLPIQEDAAVLRKSVEVLNFCFFFAPAFHPAFKEIMPVRKALAEEKTRSIFNILGPLINPAKPKYQLLGVFAPEWVPLLADVLTAVGVKRGLAACCEFEGGVLMDELTSAGQNRVAGIGSLGGFDAIDLKAVGVSPSELSVIRGGSPAENVALFEAMIAGGGRPGLVETIALNAGAALWIAEAAPDLKEGVAMARDCLQGGRTAEWVSHARDFYAEL